MTYDERLREEALDRAVEARESHWTHVDTLRHEDGSVTVIQVEEYIEEWMSPREADGNVSKLVMQHRDYRDLDEEDEGIEEARDRWGEESPLVERYVRMFRPDIAHYEPRWTVSGASQGDWAYGYGYVLTADAERIAVVPEPRFTHDYNRAHPRSRRFREYAREAFEEELAVYGAYFAGEVYFATHLTLGEPIVRFGEQGAYVAGYEVEEESVGGFLGYDSNESIAAQLTGSPVAV